MKKNNQIFFDVIVPIDYFGLNTIYSKDILVSRNNKKTGGEK